MHGTITKQQEISFHVASNLGKHACECWTASLLLPVKKQLDCDIGHIARCNQRIDRRHKRDNGRFIIASGASNNAPFGIEYLLLPRQYVCTGCERIVAPQSRLKGRRGPLTGNHRLPVKVGINQNAWRTLRP